MTRHTEPLRDITATVRIEVDGERDERDSYRHKWVTRVRCGLLRGAGPNTATATTALADELHALAECPEAVEALAMARHRAGVARAAAEAAAKPPPEPEPFAVDEEVEVKTMSGGDPAWHPATFESREGARFRVYAHRLGGYLTVERSYIRAVNRPSLAAVG